VGRSRTALNGGMPDHVETLIEYVGPDRQRIGSGRSCVRFGFTFHFPRPLDIRSVQISPPLARMFCPVIQRESSLASSATTSAMSCGWPALSPKLVCIGNKE
jgi:hypothetical protein